MCLALPHDPLPLLQLEIPALEKHHPELAIVALEHLPKFLRGVIGVRLQQLHPVGEPVQRVSAEAGYLARAARRTQGVLGSDSIDIDAKPQNPLVASKLVPNTYPTLNLSCQMRG